MKRRFACIALLVLVIFCAGCFDTETEVRFLSDGSGFVTQWVRMDLADVAAAAALNRTSVTDWADIVSTGVASVFLDLEGIELLDSRVFSHGEKLVLRYRFAFANTKALNAFLQAPGLEGQLVFPAKAQFNFRAFPQSCGGSYRAEFTFSPRSRQSISSLDYREIDALPPEYKEPILKKFYSGQALIRVVLPGKTQAHSAQQADARGYPIYKTTVLDLFREGLSGKVESVRVCKPGEKAKDESANLDETPITFGKVLTGDEILAAAQSMANYLTIAYDLKCDARQRVSLSVSFIVSSPMHTPFEFFFPLLLNAFPRILTDYEMNLEQISKDKFRYRFSTRKPIALHKLKSNSLFFGKEKDHFTFRMNLPQMVFAEDFAPGTAATTLIQVSVEMPEKIVKSNATEVTEKTATWVITDKMMQKNRITIEALTQ
jgi:hypothetical protein